MSDTHEIAIEIPSTVTVTLRGHNRDLDTTKLPDNVLVWLLEKGIQRGSNDPLGALFKKGEEVDPKKIDEYWNDLTTRWEKGEVEKRRSGGLGRTTDPVMREMKRLANEEITANIGKLLANHGVTRKEFDETYRVKYLKKRLADHGDRLREAALENLAKLKESVEEEDFEMIDFDAEPEEETEESEFDPD